MSGDHPVTPILSQPVDVVSWLRCEADAAAREPAPWEMLSKAASEIERLRAERDEARREIIFLTCDICEEDECRFEVMDRARSKRGWEYLKENKENTND